MNDLETPEEFASRQWAWLDREKMTESIRARDAAVRREAFALAAAECERRAVMTREIRVPASYALKEAAAGIRALAGGSDG